VLGSYFAAERRANRARQVRTSSPVRPGTHGNTAVPA
jgi:hypothetical protein